MKYLPICLVLFVAVNGCSAPNQVTPDRDSDFQYCQNAQPPIITAAYVEVGPRYPLAQRATITSAPDWIMKAADSSGLVVYRVGPWQELPKVDKCGMLMTQRESVTCQVREIRADGQVVVEASTSVSKSVQLITLGPGARQEAFIHLAGRDAVAIRLGWEGQAPAPIFARALLVYTRAGLHQGWPADLPVWVAKDFAGSLHGAAAKDLGSGRWVPLGPDLTQVGVSAEQGEIMARIVARERQGCVGAEAVLSKDVVDGHPLRKIVTVQPVMPGNRHPGVICSFQRSDDQDSYIAVVFHYGPIDALTLSQGTEKAGETGK